MFSCFGFVFLWLLDFKDSTILECFWMTFGPYHQVCISCFLRDIDPISKIFNILLNGSSSFPGARFFHTCQQVGFPTCWDSYNSYFQKCVSASFCFCVGVLVSPKIKHIGFGGLDTSQNPEIMEMRSCKFSHKQIENIHTKSKQNNFPELVSLLFKHIVHTNCLKRKKCLNYVCLFLLIDRVVG